VKWVVSRITREALNIDFCATIYPDLAVVRSAVSFTFRAILKVKYAILYLAAAHVEIGFAKYCLGCGEELEDHVNEALRLSPRDAHAFRWLFMVGFAKLQISADAEAVGWFRRSIEANRNVPITHFGLSAALALLGSLDEARSAAKAGLTLDPSFTIRRPRWCIK